MHILIMLRCAILSVNNRKLRCTIVFHPDDQKHILRIDSHPDKALLRVSQLFHTLYCIVKQMSIVSIKSNLAPSATIVSVI